MKTLSKLALLGALSAAGHAQAGGNDAVATIKNDSAWEIHHLHISDSDSQAWGPDQLGDEIIATGGGQFSITGIPCGEYDVKVVDEDGDECILEKVALCAAEDAWTVTDEDLLGCQAASAE